MVELVTVSSVEEVELSLNTWPSPPSSLPHICHEFLVSPVLVLPSQGQGLETSHIFVRVKYDLREEYPDNYHFIEERSPEISVTDKK